MPNITLSIEVPEGFSVLVFIEEFRHGLTEDVWVHDSSFHWRNIVYWESRAKHLDRYEPPLFLKAFSGFQRESCNIRGSSLGQWMTCLDSQQMIPCNRNLGTQLLYQQAGVVSMRKDLGATEIVWWLWRHFFKYHIKNYCHQPACFTAQKLYSLFSFRVTFTKPGVHFLLCCT